MKTEGSLAILKDLTGAPESFQVLPLGMIEIKGDAPVELDEAAAMDVIAAFMARGNDMVIDYEHQTLDGTQAPAAGWIKSLTWKGAEGLWAVVEWTKRAKEYLDNREYRYFSPVLFYGKADRKVRELINVALTNSPLINNLKPLVAKDRQDAEKGANIMIEKLRKALGLAVTAGEDMVVEAVTAIVAKCKTFETASPVIACKEVLDALGAKADAGKDEVVRIVATLKTPPAAACKEVLEALGAKEGAGKDEVLQLVASLKAPADVAKTLSHEVAILKQKIASMEQEDLVKIALSEGKISPDEVEKWGKDLAAKNPDSFKLIVLSRPAGSVVPLDQIRIAAKDTPHGMGDTQKKINEMAGVSEETFQKYNK